MKQEDSNGLVIILLIWLIYRTRKPKIETPKESKGISTLAVVAGLFVLAFVLSMLRL